MIVSFSRSFVFVAIPKTGTQALRRALRPLLAPSDWEQCGLFERRRCPVPALAAMGHGHQAWDDIAAFLLPGQWERMESFAVVRDPVDRFLSYARFRMGRDPRARADPRGTMERALENAAGRDPHVLLRPQHRFVCDASGALRVGRVLRHETLARDLAALARDLDLPLGPPDPVNVSPPNPGAVADGALLAMIREAYAEDFRLFGYDAPC